MPSYLDYTPPPTSLDEIREKMRVEKETDERHYQKVMPVAVEWLKKKGACKPTTLLGWCMAITKLEADEVRRQLWHMLDRGVTRIDGDFHVSLRNPDAHNSPS